MNRHALMAAAALIAVSANKEPPRPQYLVGICKPYVIGRNAAKRAAREQAKRYKGPAKTPKGSK